MVDDDDGDVDDDASAVDIFYIVVAADAVDIVAAADVVDIVVVVADVVDIVVVAAAVDAVKKKVHYLLFDLELGQCLSHILLWAVQH